MSENFQPIPVSTSSINDQPTLTCDGRALHEFLEVGRDFSNWIKSRIEKYGFTEGIDFVRFANSGESAPGGDNRTIDYTLTLDMAKQLAMVENNEKGVQVRRYFIECERVAKEAADQRGQPLKTLRERIIRQLRKRGGAAQLRDVYTSINNCPADAAKRELATMRKEGLVEFQYPGTWMLVDRPRQPLPAPEPPKFICPNAAPSHPWPALANVKTLISESDYLSFLNRVEECKAMRARLSALVHDIVMMAAGCATEVENLSSRRDDKTLHWLAHVLDPHKYRWRGFDNSVFTRLDDTVSHCRAAVSFIHEIQTAA